MRTLALILGLPVVAFIAFLIFAPEADRRQDFASNQRILIAKQLKTPVGALKTRTELSDVQMVHDTLAHVRSRYWTKIGGPIRYQMTVRRLHSGGLRAECFKIEGEGTCF